VPEALLLRVRLDERDLLLGPPGEAQVAQGLRVDGEDRAGRPVLRGHVPDRGAVGQRHRTDPRPVELDELPDHAVLAQHLRDRQNEVGCGRSLRHVAVEAEADHARDEHRHRLTEHRGLGLDAANAPTEHAEPVDHRRVRVGPDQRVGIGRAVASEDDTGQVFNVDLVDDPRAGWDDLEVVERPLAPAQELVALVVALVFELDVAGERVRRAEQVGDDRVVDHQLGRGERVDPGGVAAEVAHGLAHGGEVDDGRHAGEVLHHDPGGGEADLPVRLGRRVPAGERADVVGGDVRAVLGAQQVFQQHLEAERQPVGPVHGGEPVDLVRRVADRQSAPGPEGVCADHGLILPLVRAVTAGGTRDCGRPHVLWAAV
jgi:hypothetical protein